MTAAETIEILPGFLREVAEEAGLEAARNLARRCGGTQLYIPKRIGDRETMLTQAVGRDAAAKICNLRPGETVLVPLGPWSSEGEMRSKVRELLQAGVGVQEIVRRLGVHRMTVYRIRSQMRDDRQLALFDDED